MIALTAGFSHHILITESRRLGWHFALRAMIHVIDNDSAIIIQPVISQAVAAVTGPKMALKRKTKFWTALTDWGRTNCAHP
ncbi:MAG: hypothetical protein DMG70_14275 [Acidobacteria bacterium]|nr:MAG: hypothetical protein DMG70_14275 [Acidobacteriota bacterium]PYY05468.1 MAG: hypothetical protein DMG69_26450 [Acidobacteriota bacterium]